MSHAVYGLIYACAHEGRVELLLISDSMVHPEKHVIDELEFSKAFVVTPCPLKELYSAEGFALMVFILIAYT